MYAIEVAIAAYAVSSVVGTFIACGIVIRYAAHYKLSYDDIF